MNWTYHEQDGCWVVEGQQYCARPSAPELQCMNIFIPAAYLDKNGKALTGVSYTTKHGATYTAATVPVVFYNDIGGYAECRPAGLTVRNRRFLKDGYVLVSVGARGRQTRGTEGGACGKAPAALVDLKAAVRWLRAHADELPAGNLDRIVSVGTSAGGAMSSLMAVTGNDVAYEPYLIEIGAEMGERDNVFAAQCYCPIVDLEHADMAYEWMFQSKKVYTFSPKTLPEVLDHDQLLMQSELAAAYPTYVNSLGLDVILGEDGRSGTYYHELMNHINDSLQVFLHRHAATEEERQALIEELDAGAGFIADTEGVARIADLDAYVRAFVGRMKGCPAFDPFEGTAPENQEMGDYGAREGDAADVRHYSVPTTQILKQLTVAHPESAKLQELSARYADDTADGSRCERARLINPMRCLEPGAASTDIAPHVRIRVGSRDADHSFSASFNLYLALRARRIDADYALVWGRGHCDADYPGAFSAWVDRIAAEDESSQ